MVLPRFLAELKHRNIYHAAIMYAAVGWMLLEAADVILPRLGLPDWAVNVVLAVVLLGFPLALVFAWIFDISAQGVVRTQPMSAESRHHFSIVSIVEFALICALVVTVGYLYLDRLSLQRGMVELESAVQEKPEPSQHEIPNPEQYRSIAVLPFADMSEAGDQAWFAEGIAEELLHALASINELRVMARTSSFAFKDTDKTVAEIAEILGVQAVLEGGVRRSGDKVRVTAQLIDAKTGYPIWSGSYQHELTDIFQLQDELALSVIKALRVKLGVVHSGHLVSEQTRNAEAYNWFIRGRALFDFPNAETHQRSIEYFSKAVAADPEYALAWGHLAFTQAMSVLWRPIDDVYESSRAAYDRALSLDPSQSEALVARAFISMVKDHDWEAAGRDLQPLVHSGSFAAITVYSSWLLPALDRPKESIRLQRLLEERDPMHAGIKAVLAYYLFWNGNTEESISKAREALAIDPGHLYALMALIEGYTVTGQYEEADAIIHNVPEGLRQHPSITARVGLYYVARGDIERAHDILLDIFQSPPKVNILIVSRLAFALGEVERAFELMQRAVKERAWQAGWIRIFYRNNERMQNHPRYLAILRQIGLDDESVSNLQDKLAL